MFGAIVTIGIAALSFAFNFAAKFSRLNERIDRLREDFENDKESARKLIDDIARFDKRISLIEQRQEFQEEITPVRPHPVQRDKEGTGRYRRIKRNDDDT